MGADPNPLSEIDSSRPIRRVVDVEVGHDPKSGDECGPRVVREERTSLGQNDSVDTVRVHQVRFFHCGCSMERELGGECAECEGQSCVGCHGHCVDCRKPVCLEHSMHDARSGERACARCHRRRRCRAILCHVLGVFVERRPADR